MHAMRLAPPVEALGLDLSPAGVGAWAARFPGETACARPSAHLRENSSSPAPFPVQVWQWGLPSSVYAPGRHTEGPGTRGPAQRVGERRQHQHLELRE